MFVFEETKIRHFLGMAKDGGRFYVYLREELPVAIAILQVEDDPNSNIKTAEDAIWWAYVTITTVGYGDKFPVTTEGWIITAILMTAGMGMFGTFTAFVASWFVKDNKAGEEKNEGEK